MVAAEAVINQLPRGEMAHILSGQFDDFDHAGLAREDLLLMGLASNDTETFALNAPGQHDRFPIGGDEKVDEDAQGGETGAASGATLGGAAGLAAGIAAIPLVGPLAVGVGIAVGAYTGSLAGAVNEMGDRPRVTEIAQRPAGVRLVVNVPKSIGAAQIVDTFRRHGAKSIEEAEGTWRDGSWADFDPVSEPRWVQAPP